MPIESILGVRTKITKLAYLCTLGEISLLNQGCFFNTFEKTQGEKTSMFWPPSENSRVIFSKTLSLWDF